MLQNILQNLILSGIPTINYCTCGGPAHLSFLSLLPGSSKIFSAGFQIYDTSNLENTLLESIPGRKWCSVGTCYDLMNRMVLVESNSNTFIAVTSALSSNRPRKGDNKAYIGIKMVDGSPIYYSVYFNKLDQNVFDTKDEELINKTRIYQDQTLTEIILLLLTETLDNVKKRYPEIKISQL